MVNRVMFNYFIRRWSKTKFALVCILVGRHSLLLCWPLSARYDWDTSLQWMVGFFCSFFDPHLLFLQTLFHASWSQFVIALVEEGKEHGSEMPAIRDQLQVGLHSWGTKEEAFSSRMEFLWHFLQSQQFLMLYETPKRFIVCFWLGYSK